MLFCSGAQLKAQDAAGGSESESNESSVAVIHTAPKVHEKKPDFNRNLYYKNKLTLSVDGGYMPKNVPFMFDFLVGDSYTMEPLRYTLIPIRVSLDWQMGNLRGPKVLRGTWDATFGGTYAAIPKGPESRFFGYIMGIRRNFVYSRWRVVPYLDGRVGIGNVDAKGPKGVWGAQGQDLTFTLMIASGARYTINQKYSLSAGVGYMHVSNMYLSEPKYLNYGINVVGPVIGLDVRLNRHRPNEAQ